MWIFELEDKKKKEANKHSLAKQVLHSWLQSYKQCCKDRKQNKHDLGQGSTLSAPKYQLLSNISSQVCSLYIIHQDF